MSLDEKRSPSFIIGSRHMGRGFLLPIKTYSVVLQLNGFGEMSDAHNKALKVVSTCCDDIDRNWVTLSELIEQNDEEKAMEILGQVDATGQSYLERNFINKSLASMENAQKALRTILEQIDQLTDDQRLHVEIIHQDCQREIEIWKEVAEYYS
jgi:hypothetical protein